MFTLARKLLSCSSVKRTNTAINSLLLHFTDTTDSSPNPKILTASGGAIVATPYVFAPTSGKFTNATDCYFSTPEVPDFDFRNKDLTIRFRIRPTANNAQSQHIFNNGYGIQIFVASYGSLIVGLSSNGTSNYLTTSTSLCAIPTGAWTAISVEIKNNVLHIYKNGVDIGETYNVTAPIYYQGTGRLMYIGGFAGTIGSIRGNLDEFLVRVGEAMAGGASSYVVETSPYS
jgi:hypothetical protein